METALKVSSELSQASDLSDKTPETPQRVLDILRRGGVYELGESFIRGEWQSDNLRDLMLRIFTKHPSIGVELPKVSPKFIAYLISDQFGNAQVGKGAYEVAKRHYDLGNDLFSAMLDKTTMTYTCGYWRDASDLEQAQVAKIDLLCRKLYLEPGMKVLDIGCGWGNFAEYAARKYGVSVVGLTVSKEQAALARERCKGLDVEIILQDYRDYRGEFDRVVSIEMIEAVGRKNIPGFFAMAQRCLKPRGLFGLQVISAETLSRSSSVLLDQYIIWLRKRIFPNGYIPNFDHIGDPNKHGLIIEDLHNFSADYAKTLYAWADRFKASWPELEAKYGEPFYRMWLYYLYGCEALFRARMVQLYQVVYSNGGTLGGYNSVR